MDDYDCSVTNRKGCNYCQSNKTIREIDTKFNLTQISIERKYVVFADTLGIKSFGINYCPICGKKL